MNTINPNNATKTVQPAHNTELVTAGLFLKLCALLYVFFLNYGQLICHMVSFFKHFCVLSHMLSVWLSVVVQVIA